VITTVVGGRFSTGEGLRLLSEPEDATGDSEDDGWRLVIKQNALGEKNIEE
jgi:hypothetical protein